MLFHRRGLLWLVSAVRYNIKATKLIMGHDIVACEEFYIHNNIVLYLERKKTVPEELLHPAYMYPSCNRISYSTDLCYITHKLY